MMVTAVVPIYNVEKYLPSCVESILAQTYQNLEIVLVDDGSPDRCGRICDEYAQKDVRIRVIHKENGGLSSARNAGIEACRSEYITFVDSDDFLVADMIEKLLKAAQNEEADIVACRFIRCREGDTPAAVKIPKLTGAVNSYTQDEKMCAF